MSITPTRLIALVVAFAALAGGAALYGTGRLSGNSGQCKLARSITQRMAPLARGEVAAVQVAADPKPLPNLAFTGPDGAATSLSAFRGRTVLFNLWATWCAPCRQEMPALDKLQAELGGDAFAVVAVNIDTRNLDKPKEWLAANNITRLGYYADPKAGVFQELRNLGKASGMPTTLIVDPQGCELATLAGPAEWASPDALALVKAALAR